jgi:hypothetical protein
VANETKQEILFEEVRGKKVQVDFDGGEVTSDTGLLKEMG